MRGKVTDLKGAVFCKLTVLERTENSKSGAAQWVVLCVCGAVKTVRASSLVDGTTKSCGCLARAQASERARTHGMTQSFEYRAWCSMWKRCTNKKHPAYHRYGGAGVVVCAQWERFENFFADMGPCPYERGSVDRIDNTCGYSAGNCRWLPLAEQSKNRRHVVKVCGKTIPDLAAANNIKTTTLRRRVKAGWSADKMFKTPIELGTRKH